MKSLVNKCLLVVFVFKLTVTCSNSRTANIAAYNEILKMSNNNSSNASLRVTVDNNGINTESNNGSNATNQTVTERAININNNKGSKIISSNNNDTTIDRNCGNTVNSDKNATSTENYISVSYNSNTADTETITDETIGTNITNNSENNKVVICYFKNWGLYKRGLAKYTPDNINTSLCTHVYYAFASLDNETLTIKYSDKNADIYKGFYKKIAALGDKGIKPILSLGGWSDSKGDKYSRLVNNVTARANFVNQSIDFLTKYNFKGLDIDWEYPVCWQGKCNASAASDKENFGNLVKELSEAYKPLGFHLSVAVAPGTSIMKKAYDVPTFSKYLDYIGLMTYDLHSYRQGRTGSQSPYLGSLGVVQLLSNWEKVGVPKSKLVMGFPTYAKTYQLKNPEEHGIGAITSGPGAVGNYSRAKGTLFYYEVCSNVLFANWTAVQTEGNGSYVYFDDQWGSYISIKDVLQRVEYIKTNGYGGALVWSLDMDDFNNMCGCGANPLLTAISTIRYTDVAIPDCP